MSEERKRSTPKIRLEKLLSILYNDYGMKFDWDEPNWFWSGYHIRNSNLTLDEINVDRKAAEYLISNTRWEQMDSELRASKFRQIRPCNVLNELSNDIDANNMYYIKFPNSNEEDIICKRVSTMDINELLAVIKIAGVTDNIIFIIADVTDEEYIKYE